MPPKKIKIKSPLRETKIRNSNSLRQNIIINYAQNKRARRRNAPSRIPRSQIVIHVHMYHGQNPTSVIRPVASAIEAEKIKVEPQEVSSGYVDPTEPKAIRRENKNDKFLDALDEVTPSLPPIGSTTIAQIELRLRAFGYQKTSSDKKQSLYEKLARNI